MCAQSSFTPKLALIPWSPSHLNSSTMGLSGAMAGTALPVAAAAPTSRRAGTRTAQPAVVVPMAVATPSKPPSFKMPKRSAVELFKEQSDFLRHPLMQVRPPGHLGATSHRCRGARRAAALLLAAPRQPPVLYLTTCLRTCKFPAGGGRPRCASARSHSAATHRTCASRGPRSVQFNLIGALFHSCSWEGRDAGLPCSLMLADLAGSPIRRPTTA